MSTVSTEAALLTKRVCLHWEISGDGSYVDKYLLVNGLKDVAFAKALFRVITVPGEERITYESLLNGVHVLLEGTFEEKAALFIKFMDENGDNSISYEEFRSLLNINAPKLYESLGYVERDGSLVDGKVLTVEDVTHYFSGSCGSNTLPIDLFCDQILQVLRTTKPKMPPVVKTPSMRDALARPRSFFFSPANGDAPTIGCIKWLSDSWQKNFALMKKALALHETRAEILLIGLQVLLWLYNFEFYFLQGYPYSFAFAKGCGLNLRILTILMFLTMSRTIMGYVKSLDIYISAFVPEGYNIEIHSFIGFSLLIHSFGHFGAHIVYDPTAHLHQKALIRGDSWSASARGDGITGLALLVGLCCMAATALLRSRNSKFYQYFHLTHFFYVLWLPILFLHVPNLWPWFLSIFALFLLERSTDFFHRTTVSTLKNSRVFHNTVSFVCTPCGRIPPNPGSYYRIKVPAISAVEWHPFSLASSVNSQGLNFFIADVGDWTHELHVILDDPERRAKTIVLVQGPFSAPAKTAISSFFEPASKPTVLVATGIGITPFFSVMATEVANYQILQTDRNRFSSLFNEEFEIREGKSFMSTVLNKGVKTGEKVGEYLSTSKDVSIKRLSKALDPRDDSFGIMVEMVDAVDDDEDETDGMVQRLDHQNYTRVIWSIRNVNELLAYVEYVCQLVKDQDEFDCQVVFVDIYLTGLGSSSDPKYMVAQVFLLAMIGQKANKFMKVHFVRPDLAAICKEISPEKVYFCGGTVVRDQLEEICLREKIPFHAESFDSGGNFHKKVLKFLSEYFPSSVDEADSKKGSTPHKGADRAERVAKKV